MFFDKAISLGGRGTWRSVCKEPLGNASVGGSQGVKKLVGETPGQGYPTWSGARQKEHGFQSKPQGTGSGDTRTWLWQTSDVSTDQYLPGYAAMWMDKHGQLWIPDGQARPEGMVRAPKHGDT